MKNMKNIEELVIMADFIFWKEIVLIVYSLLLIFKDFPASSSRSMWLHPVFIFQFFEFLSQLDHVPWPPFDTFEYNRYSFLATGSTSTATTWNWANQKVSLIFMPIMLAQRWVDLLLILISENTIACSRLESAVFL